jgi:transcriptional regulator with XRE-family HTH domain
MPAPDEDDHLRRGIARYLREAERGAAAELAKNTSLTAAELSQFLNGHRPLTAQKVIEVYDYLISHGKAEVKVWA